MAATTTRMLPPRRPNTKLRSTPAQNGPAHVSHALLRGNGPDDNRVISRKDDGKIQQKFFTGSKAGSSSIRTSTPSPPPDDGLDLADPEPVKPGVDEIKKRMYTRECTRLGVTPVGAFMRAPTRTELQIRHYSLGPTGARALSVPLMLDSTLTTLDLEGNALGPEGVANLKEMLLDHCGITQLNLKRNNLGNRGALLICQVLQSNRLITSINVAANDFEDKAGLYFANMLKANTQLKTLDLSDNKLADIAGRQLGQALGQNETLEYLDLCWNHFSGNGAVKLLEGVTENISLKTISLAYNCFGCGRKDRTPNFLADLLSSNSALLHLDLSSNRLSDLDVVMVAKGLKVNEVLQSLKIGRNLVGVGAAKALITAMATNESSKLTLLNMDGLPLAEDDIEEVEQLMSRGIKVTHGNIHQRETDFDSEPSPNRQIPGSSLDEEESDSVNRPPSTEEGDEVERDTTASATYIGTTEKPVDQD